MGEARRRKLAGNTAPKTERIKKRPTRVTRMSVDDGYVMAMALMAGMINRPRLPWVIQRETGRK